MRQFSFASVILLVACNHATNDDIGSTVQQCTLDDDANVCNAPPQSITASANEAGAPAIHAGTTYVVAASSHRSYVAFTPTATGTHTLYFGEAAPARVCDEAALCASEVTSCGDFHRAAQYALAEGEHYVIELKASNDPFRIHIVAPPTEPPPPPQTGVKLAPPVYYATTGTYVGAINLGDLNGDGAIDVVVSNPNDAAGQNWIDIMRNDGTGAFAFAFRVTTSAPNETVISDFDSDGDADIAGVGSDGMGPLANFFLHNQGSFQFTKTQWTPTLQYRGPMDGADFDEDGVTDLLIPYTPEGVAQRSGFTILKMPSTETLQEVDNGLTSTDAIAGDFNGDGHQDVILSDGFSTSVRLYLGNGTGTVTFDRDILLAVTDPVFRLVAVNLDGNAYTDFVAFGGGEQDDMSVTLSSASGFTSQRILGGEGVAAGDFDHDGRIDLITGVPNAAADPDLVFWRNTVNGFVGADLVPGGASRRYLVGADVNNDGLMDLVTNWGGGTTAGIAVHLGTP